MTYARRAIQTKRLYAHKKLIRGVCSLFIQIPEKERSVHLVPNVTMKRTKKTTRKTTSKEEYWPGVFPPKKYRSKLFHTYAPSAKGAYKKYHTDSKGVKHFIYYK